MPSALVLLADGLEEIEAVTIIDVLRRGDVDVITAGLEGTGIHGSHDIRLQADTTLKKASESEYDVVVLPGGEPGTTNLEQNKRVKELLANQLERGGRVGAICAAPRILAEIGLLDGKPATSHPGVRDRMENTNYSGAPVVKTGRVVTSRGPGTALPFSLQLVEDLVGPEKAGELADYMEYSEFSPQAK